MTLHEVGGVGPHRPFVAVGADLALHVEVVEQDELPRERVMVWRDAFGEQAEGGIAVSLRHVAKHLVVGAVFLDHVDHVGDRARLAGLKRDRMTLQFFGREHVVGPGRAAGERAGRPGVHPFLEGVFRKIDERHGAIKQAPDVVGRGSVGIVSRPGSVAVGVGDHALPVGDEQPRAVGGEPDGRRIPANRNEAQASRPALLRHVPDAQGVDVGV